MSFPHWQLLTALLFVGSWWIPGRPFFSTSSAVAIVAMLVLGLACYLAVVGYLHLGRSFRVAPQPRSDGGFVRRGIYRWLRHPMYTAVIIGSLAVFLLRPTYFVLVTCLGQVGLYIAKAGYEERLMCRIYPEYREYRRHTMGVIPFV